MKKKLHSYIFFILISALFFQALSKFIIYTDYILNKDFITANLCVNKAKPILKCNGKCHLAKQLKKQDQKENKSSSLKEKLEIVSNQLPFSSNEIEFNITFQECKKEVFLYFKNTIKRDLSRVYPPPKA